MPTINAAASSNMLWDKWRWTFKVTECQEAADRKNSKACYDGLKKVYDPEEHGVTLMFSPNRETLLVNESDTLSRWKDHFEAELSFTSVTNDDVTMSIPQRAEIPELSLDPIFLEVAKSIK